LQAAFAARRFVRRPFAWAAAAVVALAVTAAIAGRQSVVRLPASQPVSSAIAKKALEPAVANPTEPAQRQAQAAPSLPTVVPSKLETAVEGKKNVKPSPGKPQAELLTAGQVDIVAAMKGLQPRVQACANQWGQRGTVMAEISVAAGGKVSGAKVTGKFAGTPTGACVEAAALSAKFPPCQAMSFPWPFTLSPRGPAEKMGSVPGLAAKSPSKGGKKRWAKANDNELFLDANNVAPPRTGEIPLQKPRETKAMGEQGLPLPAKDQKALDESEPKPKAKPMGKSKGGKSGVDWLDDVGKM
jgi:hypothetical protein